MTIRASRVNKVWDSDNLDTTPGRIFKSLPGTNWGAEFERLAESMDGKH